MDERIREAFSQIRAEDALKRSTSEFIASELEKRKAREKSGRAGALKAALCAAAALVVIFFGGYLYFNPVSYISLDVNPSIELELNVFDIVVSATGYNDDGELLAGEVNLKNKKYTDAIEELLESGEISELIESGEELVFTVVSDDDVEIAEGIRSCGGYEESNATCESASYELREEARSAGLSMGKYREYLRIAQYDPEITPEDCNDMTMRELRELAGSYESADGQDGDEAETQGETCSNGGGNGGRGHGNSGSGNGKHRGEGRNR